MLGHNDGLYPSLSTILLSIHPHLLSLGLSWMDDKSSSHALAPLPSPWQISTAEQAAGQNQDRCTESYGHGKEGTGASFQTRH